MTIVNHETGEITELISADDARNMTTQAQQEFRSSAEHFKNGWAIINLAVLSGGHIALGYRSPGDYVHAEFDGLLSNLDVAERRLAVREMTAMGMSTRAIAPVVGVDPKTVRNDTASGGDMSPPQTPQDEVPSSGGPVSGSLSGVRSSSDVASAPRPAVIVGIDGKNYSRPEPKAKPVVLTDSDADYDNAEKACKALSNAIAKLLEFQHPNMRDAMRRYWSMASNEVPSTPRRDVTPEQMGAAAQGLLALADEWSTK